jgi:hypothetical protein
MEPEKNLSDNEKKALTSIRDTYTLSYTKENENEVDDLTVKNFLNTLAEVALAIASRKVARQ